MTILALLDILCKTNSDSSYEEFVNRFYSKVAEECKKKCKKRGLDIHIGEQITHDTFERVRKYKSFDKEKLKSKNPEYAILGWLFRISSNLFYDYHNKVQKQSITPDFYFAKFDEINENVDVKELYSKKEAASFIFGKLNKKEKEVILTDIEFKKGKKYLNSDVLESLSARLNVKKDTVRRD